MRYRRFFVFALLLAMCLGFLPRVNALPDFNLSASPTSLTFNSGSSAGSTVTVQPTGSFTGTVTLSLTISPATGLSCSLNPSSVTLPPSPGTSALSCTGTVGGTFNVNVTGTSGLLAHSIIIPVDVLDFSVTANPVTVRVSYTGSSTINVTSINGFLGTVLLSDNVSPSGLSCSLNPNSLTLKPSATSLTSTLSCSGPAGTYAVTVAGSSGSLSHSTTVTFTVQDFTVQASPAFVSTDTSGYANSTITITSINGLTGSITLAETVSPASGLGCTLLPSTVTLGISVTSKLACLSTLPGIYTVTVTGSNGTLVRTVTVTITVQDFIIASSSSTIIANAGNVATSILTVVELNGYTGTVFLSTTISPTIGLTCSVTPTNIGLGTFGISTISCSGMAGIYNVTVTGSSGPLLHSAIILVTVRDFTLSASQTSTTVNSGTQSSWTISVLSEYSFTGTVNLVADVSPQGLTCSISPDSISLGTSSTSILSCSGSTPGAYTVTITGTSDSISKSTTLAVIVAAQPATATLFYFLILAAAIGAGATATFRKFNTTTGPFGDLFKLTGGEFNSPTTLLIIGESGAGKSTLGTELLYRQLSGGKSCGLLTYDSFPSEIQKRMKDMGWDVTRYLENGALKIIDCYSTLTGDDKMGIKDPTDFTEVSIRVSDIIEKATVGPVTILLDSITPTFNSAQSKVAINFFRALGAKIKNSGGVFIMTATMGSISQEVRSNIEAMVDGVIELRMHSRKGSIRRVLTVKKMSGHEISQKPTEFEIVGHKGIIFKRIRFKLQPFRTARTASTLSTS